MIDVEQLFQQLAAKSWDDLSELLFKNKHLINKDPYIGRVTELFEMEFFGYIAKLPANERLMKMRDISLIVELDRNSFAESFVNSVIDARLIALKESGDKSLANYASTYFDRPLAKRMLEEIRCQFPEQLAEARQAATKIDVVSKKESEAKTIRLFKSRQEENFYSALKESFPQYLIYPNVAVSCVIDLNRIRKDLTAAEIDYYFKSILDFVLFDPLNNYEPIYFFELDSKFHDSDSARRNDGMKNAICRAAGVKLVRLRSSLISETEVDNFKKLVIDLIA